MKEMPPVIATVGGRGTRLFPLTLHQPKPLVEMCNKSILAILFEGLANQGCREFYIASKGDVNTTRLKEYFKEGKGFSGRLGLDEEVEFRYQPRYDDQGSGDAIRFCMEYFNIDEDVLVVSGDNVVDIEIREMLEFHKKKNALLTIGLKILEPQESISQFGVAEITDDNRIIRFVEKPKKGKEPSRLVNTAIYLFSPEIKDVFDEMGDRVRDVGKDVIPYLTDKGYPIYGFPFHGYWADVGTPGRYLQTSFDVLQKKLGHIKLINECEICGINRWVLSSTEERNKSKLLRGSINLGEYTLIGRDCEIGENVWIENSSIGDNCIIEDNVTIKNSVVMDFVNIGKHSTLNKCVVGRYTDIGAGSLLDSDFPLEFYGKDIDKTVVIGENVEIYENSVIGPGKRVAPLKETHEILKTGKYIELGMDEKNLYFMEA
ncbi:MAG: sugar phosphate nucleotidyltransferase [Candidatus Hydrothermarchaeota archaeon]